VVKGLIWSQVKDRPPNHAHTLWVYGNGPFRPLEGIGVVAPYYLAKPAKRVQGADSTCPRCGEEEEDLEHILRACPELDSPKRRNFVQVPLLLSAMLTDQVEVAPFFREVFE
jgi:ribosomal protein S27AE